MLKRLQTTAYYVQLFLFWCYLPLAVEKGPSGGDRSTRTAGLPKR